MQEAAQPVVGVDGLALAGQGHRVREPPRREQTLARRGPRQSSSSRATPSTVGSWANAAPLSAPIEQPERRAAGAISCSTSERSMPTWTAPWLPPPESTSATGPDRRRSRSRSFPIRRRPAAARSAPGRPPRPGWVRWTPWLAPSTTWSSPRGADSARTRAVRWWCGRDSLPWAASTGTSSSLGSYGGGAGGRIERSSATSAGPSARRWSRVRWGSSSHRSSPTIRRMNRSAASAGLARRPSAAARAGAGAATTTAATPSATRRRPPPGASSGWRAAKASATTPPRL